MAETYSIGSTDLATVFTSIQTLDPVVIPSPAQQDYVVPGRDGVVAANAWKGPKTWSVAGVIVGSDRADAISKLQTLAALVWGSGSTFTITRVVGSTTSTASARFLSWSTAWQAPNIVRVAVDFQLMDGQFKNGGSLAL